MRILRKFFKTNFGCKLIWLVVISSILMNIVGVRYEFQNYNLIDHPYLGILLRPFTDIRYGYFVARKLFLVVIAFLVFGYWLTKQEKILQQIRRNIAYIVLIGLSVFLTRILTFGFWFYNDDTRFFHYHLNALTHLNYTPQGVWGPIGSHPIALLLLVISWFGTNYSLYNALGLFFYFLAGVAIFVLANRLQKNKFVSLTAAIFFLTTPTYFQGRLLIGEVVNSPFILLLVVLSIYLLLQKFIPGALIFAAAALEYGVAKAYFIALPLTLFAIFFTNRKKHLFFFIAAIFLISLVYLPSFYGAPGSPGSISKIFTFHQLFVFGDVLLSVILPYGLSYPLVRSLSLILDGWIYITAALGFLIVACFTVIGAISILRGKMFSAKLIVIALSIIIPTAGVASIMGVRVSHNVQKLVEYHNNGFPTGATGYGFFPAFGLTLALIGLGYLIKKRVFLILAVLLILVNTVSSIFFDYKWLQSPYSYPQRRYDEQLKKILLRDGINKYVYVPSKQRSFYQGVVTFVDIFQGDQNYYLFMDPGEFAQALIKNKAQSDHIYFFITSGKPDYKIYDYSGKIRAVPYDKLIPLLQSLKDELTPHPTYF
ncbi:MAG: hypothetical protein Q7S60_00895 [bacterium]|nr:hypothetical protein [bacterium]